MQIILVAQSRNRLIGDATSRRFSTMRLPPWPFLPLSFPQASSFRKRSTYVSYRFFPILLPRVRRRRGAKKIALKSSNILDTLEFFSRISVILKKAYVRFRPERELLSRCFNREDTFNIEENFSILSHEKSIALKKNFSLVKMFLFYIINLSRVYFLQIWMIKGRAREKTTQSSFFNVSLLIVHCRLRDIVILTIHLYLHVSHNNNNINNINSNRNCIPLLQIYRCAACVLCMYTLCYLLVLYKNEEGNRSTRLGKVFVIFVDMPRRERKTTIQQGTGRGQERRDDIFFKETLIDDLNKK